jgi:hypothetical protein
MLPGERERLLAQEAFEGLFTRLIHESHLHAMQRMARQILIADSFGLGACSGFISYPVHESSGVLQLGQVFLLADLHDQVCRPLSASSFMGPRAGTALFTRGLFAFGEAEWLQRRLTKAHAKRELLYNELKSIMGNPADFFEGLPGKAQQSYQAKWQRFAQLHQAPEPRSQLEAGKVFGELLLEVLLAIANLVAMTDALVKLGAKAPELLNAARTLKNAGRTGGAAASEPAIVETAAPPRRAKVRELDWVTIQFVDDAGVPMANETYEVTLADGSTQRGTLDADGLGELSGIVAGSCAVSFPGFKPRLAG